MARASGEEIFFVNFHTVSVLQSTEVQYQISCNLFYNLESDSYLVIEELECLEFQLIIGIYGSRFFKIYFLDSLPRVHTSRTLLNV